MRDFFIKSFEVIVSIVVIVSALVVFVGGLVMMFSHMGGFLQGLLFWVLGAIYVLFVGGAMFLGLGIYQNTKRTADATERLANRN